MASLLVPPRPSSARVAATNGQRSPRVVTPSAVGSGSSDTIAPGGDPSGHHGPTGNVVSQP